MEKDLAKNIVDRTGKIGYNMISTKEKESIQKKSYISNALNVAGDKAKYNAQVKKILSDINILAWILKYSTSEFKDYSIAEIKESIEGTPEVSSVPLYPGKQKPESIIGMDTSNQIPNEGEVTYDILFHAFTYDQIKKVYSIWICMDVPKYAANTLTEYRIDKHNHVGNFNGRVRYDLLSVVMVCLGGEQVQVDDNSQSMKLHGLLSTILSGKLTVEEKERKLNNEYGIVAKRDMKKEMIEMCNLADLVEERGKQQEKMNIILNMIKKGMSDEDICSLAECSQELVDEIRNGMEDIQEK